MSKFEITCPSCGMILELKQDGMQRCKYCQERIYIMREQGRIIVRNLAQKDGEHAQTYEGYGDNSKTLIAQYRDRIYKEDGAGEEEIEYIHDDSGDYDDLEEGEKKIPPELLEQLKEQRRNKKMGPLSTIVFLLAVSVVLFSFISQLQKGSGHRIKREPPQEQRTERALAKKSIAQEVSSPHMVKFVEAMFEKQFSKITQSDYERVRYLKVVRPEFESSFFYIEYALDELDFMDEFQVIDLEKLRKSDQIRRVDLKIEGENAFFLPIYDFQPFSNLVVLDLTDSEIMVDFSGDHEQHEFHLKNLKHLRALSLPQNERLENLERLLTDLEHLTSLTGELYHIERFSSIAYRFESLRELRILRFDDLELKDMSFLKEFENLQTLQVRMLEDNSYLADLKSLKKLILNAGRQDRNYDVLKEMGQLESLEIRYGGSLKNLDFLEAMPNLKVLRISDSEISDIEVLKKLKLEELRLEKNMELMDYSVIGELKDLKYLGLFTWWADKSAKLFKAEQLPNLKRLEIMGGWVSRLGKAETVEELTLIGSVGDEIYLETIPKMPALKRLSFTDEAYLFNAKALEKFGALREVSFYKTRLQYLDLAELFNLKSVEKIEFFGVQSFAIDLKELETNQSLKSLSFESPDLLYFINHSNNNVDKKPHSFADHPEIFEIFEALEELSLVNSGVKDTKFRKKMPHLKRLIIDGKVN